MSHGPPTKTIDEAAGEALLSAANLGFDPFGLYSQLAIEADDLAGGTWGLYVSGANGAYKALVTGLTTEIVQFGPRQASAAAQELPYGGYTAVKVVFVGGAGTAEVNVRAEAP